MAVAIGLGLGLTNGGRGISYGPELVVNGTFDTDTTGWTPQNSATLSVVSGALRITNGAAASGRAEQTITVEAGAAYRYSIRNPGSSSTNFSIGTATNGVDVVAVTTVGVGATVTGTFVAPGTSVIFIPRNSLATLSATRDLDDISLRKVQ